MEYTPSVTWLQNQLSAVEQMLSTTSNFLMRLSLQNRVADLKQQIADAGHQPCQARLDVWFSGRAVYGSQGISSGFMNATMQAIVGMIWSTTREKVRQLKEQNKHAEMPRGHFYVTALTHGSFGYELSYKDEKGQLFDTPAVIESIRSTMGVIETTTDSSLDVDNFIKEQPIRFISNLKDLFTTLKKQGSTLRMESGSSALSLDGAHVNVGYDNICLSDITQKAEDIIAVFKGAFIETGKFEYTDVEGRVRHGNISDDLSADQIAALNVKFSQKECTLQVIRRIVTYTSGRKKENVELTGIV